MMRSWPARLSLAVTILAAATQCYAGAGIATDGSVGTRQTIAGANAGAGTFLIPQTLGYLSGSNLFHSFSAFNIDSGQSATFVTTTNTIANVISRVTGGSLSQINGPLKLTPVSGTPNFFFINPAGITFGAGASIDVPGAFHVSTSDTIKFPDGNFHADLNQASTFSSAPPEAFGFLGTTRASITVNGGAALTMKPSQPISIVGGDIEIDTGTVSTHGGDIRVVALGQKAQEVGFSGTLPSADGNLTIKNGSSIVSSTLGSIHSGAIGVNAGNIAIDRQGNSVKTGIFSNAIADSTGNAGNVDVMATGNLSVINGGRIFSSTSSSGNAGSVKAGAGSITIDGNGSLYLTGIWSDASTGSGTVGSVEVSANGNFSIANGGEIFSDAGQSSNAGLVKVSAGSIAIDGQNSSNATGIFTEAQSSAGSVQVSTTGVLSIVNAGIISSNVFSSGNAGDIKVNAGSLAIDGQGSALPTGIYIDGKSGSIDVATTGTLSISNAGKIWSNLSSSGNAASLKVSADSIAIDGHSSSHATGILSEVSSDTGNNGSVDVSVAGNLSIANGGSISADSNNGSVKVSADSIAIGSDGRISSNSSFFSGNAGSVDVTSDGNISIVSGGSISASSGLISDGKSGTVKVSAGSITIDALDSVTSLTHQTGILSTAGTSGSGRGSIEITLPGSLSIANSGVISTNTSSSHDAGPINVSAGSITIGPENSAQGSTAFTGIFSEANIISGGGNGGNIDVTTPGNLSIFKGGLISASTWSRGNAGTVKVSAGSINIYDQGSWATGIVSNDRTLGHGNAGSVDVTATGNLSLVNGGIISSSAEFASGGDAGTVKVNAGSITIDGQDSNDPAAGSSTQKVTGILSRHASGAIGNAGNVEVMVNGELSISNGGSISSVALAGQGTAGAITVNAGSIVVSNKAAIMSSTYASGNAGVVNISADTITLQGGYVLNQAESGSTGNAGEIKLTATGSLSLLNGGWISAATKSVGSAGNVLVSAGTLLVDGASSSINAKAVTKSFGQTGNVDVKATDSITLSNGGQISIANDTSIANPSAITPTFITVTAPSITALNSPNAITTSSTGNIAAGSIKISASDRLYLDPSGITTTSNLGNGGAIDIAAGILRLDNSQIATSVTGLTGNGGNIAINADTLILNTGFIQANTAAANASGGTVSIAAQNLIPSGNTLFLGGNTPYTYQPGVFGFNVIQAAAPTGLSGAIQMSTPVLDVSGSLGGLYTQVIDTGGLSRSPCQTTGGSSLAQSGRGGLPPSARGLLRAEPAWSLVKSSHLASTGADYLRVVLSNWGCS